MRPTHAKGRPRQDAPRTTAQQASQTASTTVAPRADVHEGSQHGEPVLPDWMRPKAPWEAPAERHPFPWEFPVEPPTATEPPPPPPAPPAEPPAPAKSGRRPRAPKAKPSPDRRVEVVELRHGLYAHYVVDEALGIHRRAEREYAAQKRAKAGAR